MKKYILMLLLFSGMAKAQIVNIPDANFKAKLLGSSAINSVAKNALGQTFAIDANADGEIQVSEAEAVYSLWIYMANVVDLTGVRSFVNLTRLECSINGITALDLTGLNNLKYLDCSENELTTINGIGLTAALEFLVCRENNIATIDVSEFPNLKTLNCPYNQLTTLDVHGLVNLQYFYCYNNQLTSLNMSGLDSLINLECSNNQLTTIDVSAMHNLTTLSCYNNQLTTMSVKNGVANIAVSFANNPLEFICADESQVPMIQNYANNYGITAVINTYCTFTPGGDFNTITGSIKFDAAGDGCDAGDVILPHVRVNINDGTQNMASFISNAGNYAAYVVAGNYTITPSIENPDCFSFSPPTANASFPDNNNNTATQDFCIASNGVHPDVEVVISPISFARPGFDATYQITYRNKGNQTVSGIVNLIFDDSKTDFVLANPLVDNLAVNSLSWNYSNLLPFESRTINVAVNVNSPLEIPAVNIGDILNFEASINTLIDDESPADNLFTYNQTVVGSYDPNDITCLEGGVVPATEIGNYLHYVINFENTGTYPAENVVVKTEIDAAKFDINSLQLMSANFPVDARITGNKVEFIFKNIQLPIGGHGHILLKMKTKNTLVTGDSVSNRGDIFFDYNAPIDTGLAHTIFENLSNTGFEMDSSIMVTPNPAAHFVSVKANNLIKSVEVYDIQGRIIQMSIINKNESKLDINSYSAGTYFIKIVTEKGTQMQKLIKN
ncbi:MAG: leucine-rich repeat domain-containing protein [Flavobacteriaceae bacterium]